VSDDVQRVVVKGSMFEVGIGSIEATRLWESGPTDEGAFAHLSRSDDGRVWLSLTDMEEHHGAYASVEVTLADLDILRRVIFRESLP
jgi:hypothetical protein